MKRGLILWGSLLIAATVLGASGDVALKERAREVLDDRELKSSERGPLLALYADSLRTVDVALAAKCLEKSGIAAFRLSQLDSALARWQRGVNWARQAQERQAESSLLNALAIGHTARGDVEAALPVYEQALKLRTELADTLGLSRTWGNLATAYSNLGRTAEALAATAEENRWLHRVDNPRGEVANAIRRAQLLTAMGRLEEALLQSRSAVDLAENKGRVDAQALANMVHGNALLDNGLFAEALPVLQESLRLMRECGDEYSESFVQQSLVQCLLALGRYPEALTRVREILPKVEDSGHLPLMTVLLRFEGNALFALGRVAEAEESLTKALDHFEDRRQRLEDERSRSGIFLASGEIYASLARCQLTEGDEAEAFATVERGRAKIFGDRFDGGQASLDSLQAHLENAQGALILFNDPGIDPLVAFVLDGKNLKVVEIGEVASLRADAQAALRLLAAGESLETCRPALARLEKSISHPLLAMIDPRVQRFSVVPPSFLTGFPLGVLQDESGLAWGQERSLSYLPNASALLALGARVAPDEGVLAFADPETFAPDSGWLPATTARAQAGVPLPEARREIRAVAFLESQRLTGKQASGIQLRQALERPLAILHLATHAVVDPIDGGRSAVVLAGAEGVDAVTAEEISTTDFHGDLVVLSGCSTFGEHRVLGEGCFGLPRSFLAAGARTVISTLWDVDDLGARRFMTEFYSALGQGRPRDEALVLARRVCRQAGMPPREWAAFVLTGVGDEKVSLMIETPGPKRFWPWGLALGLAVVLLISAFARRNFSR